ncbi:DUF742 domain-containing protein [Streptomyces sp. NPDC051018]|uniref:DUF742 domain-containing protein n=1 Tax=Streptomyces sp. NPDC051018 TaxID=3365639 RepID=UPI0037BB66D2
MSEPRVRPYGLTGGRTCPRYPLRLESLIGAGPQPPPDRLAPEHAQAVALCRSGGTSVAEIAAGLQLPVQVTKVITADLLDQGALVLCTPAVADGSNPQFLEALLVALDRKFSAA